MTTGRRSDPDRAHPDRHDLGVERQVRGSVPNWLMMNQDWRDHTRRRWWDPLILVAITLAVLGVVIWVAGCASDDDGRGTASSGATTSEAAPAPSGAPVVWDAPVAESVTVGYLRLDPAELDAAIDALPSGDGEVIGMPDVSDTANTEMVLYGADGTGVAEWDLYALVLERDTTGTLDAALTTEQGTAREAVSAFGRLLDDTFVAVTQPPADRLEVWAPYAITDAAVHWPGPPITDVVHDEGCGVVEGADAETIRAHLEDGTTITDEPGLVVLALLAPQEEACRVHQ